MTRSDMTPPDMTLHWTKEDAPVWDAGKRAVFGRDELAATGLVPPADGTPVADEWWRVTDEAGAVVGYGWLDSEWGDAQITFLVAAGHRGAGIGEFIVGQLEAEAARRGVNYIYNVVPATHPDPAWITRWLTAQGFAASESGDLRRQVRHEAQNG